MLFLEITWKLPIHTSASSLSFTVMIRDLEKLLNTSCPFLPNAFNGLSELGDTLLSVVVIHSSLINFVLSKPFVSKHPCSSVVVSINSTDRKAFYVNHYIYIRSTLFLVIRLLILINDWINNMNTNVCICIYIYDIHIYDIHNTYWQTDK